MKSLERVWTGNGILESAIFFTECSCFGSSWAAVLQRMEEHQVDVRDRLQRIHNAVQVLTLQAQQQQREQVQ